MPHIQRSVGLAGHNRRQDVAVVQQLLDSAGVSPGPVDGRCGRLTMHAIEVFQVAFLPAPDGRVDVNGPTWRHLTSATESPVRLVTPASARTLHRHLPAPAQKPMPSLRPAPIHAAPVRHASPAVVRKTATARQPAAAPPPTAAPSAPGVKEFWRTPTKLPSPGTVNRGLSSPRSAEQIARFGKPSEKLYRDGGPITNKKLLALMVTESVGRFRVSGLRPAVVSLRAVLAAVAREQPELYGVVGTVGMLNNRLQRHSNTKLSNHAFGTAIDLTIGGVLTQQGHGTTRGLDTLAPFFNRAGWVWGATFSPNDAMHFECGTALLDSFGL